MSKRVKVSSVLDQACLFNMSAVQMFLTAPNRMIDPKFSPGELEDWKDHPYRSKVKVYVHAPYVLNFVDSGRIGSTSVHFIKSHMNAAFELGAEGTIVHCGSWKDKTHQSGLDSGKKNIEKILEGTLGTMLIENMASGGERTSLSTIQELLKDFPKWRTGICFDTAHAYGAGIDVSREDVVVALFQAYDSLIKLVHINDVDPKVVLGKGLDRHDNFGRIENGLKQMFSLYSADFILERKEDFLTDLQKMREWSGLDPLQYNT